MIVTKIEDIRLPIIRVKFAFPDLIDICVLYSNVRQRLSQKVTFPLIAKLTTAMIWSSMIVLLYYTKAPKTKIIRRNLRERPWFNKELDSQRTHSGARILVFECKTVAHPESALLRIAV